MRSESAFDKRKLLLAIDQDQCGAARTVSVPVNETGRQYTLGGGCSAMNGVILDYDKGRKDVDNKRVMAL